MDWTLIVGLLVAVVGVIGGLLTAKVQNKGRPEHALIDQLQEQIEADRTARDKSDALMRQDIKDLKDEQVKSRRRERIRDDYINRLRRHIESQLPPPAPEWPEGLYD